MQTTGALQPDGSLRRSPDRGRSCCARGRYMATLPLDANVQFMTVMATGMPFAGRG